MHKVTVAVTQMACSWDRGANLDQAEALVRTAADRGANVILLQELFETPYFCQEQQHAHNALAAPIENHPWLDRFQVLARELGVVLPVSFFERAGNTQFNSLAMIDADGTLLGCYRKTHIPDGPGYSEKFYFTPGDTGFKVWQTRYGRLGVGICWDQWFPEAARIMALMGAEILLYPTAIGSEPQDPSINSMRHWQNTQRGHAAANLMPLAASNRVGLELAGEDSAITFYGHSFISGADGELVAEAGDEAGEVLTATFDLDELALKRRAWGVFRDRRVECYQPLLTVSG